MSYLEIDDLKLYYEVKGEGTPVVFLHDGLIDSQVWEHQFTAFSKFFQVVRYDCRGYGRSNIPAGAFSMVDDLYALLTHLNLSKVILIGGSMGGSTALDFSLAHPQMVSRLVLVGASISGFPFSEHFLQRVQGILQPMLETETIETTLERYANDPYLIASGNDMARKELRTLLTKNRQTLEGVKYLMKQNLVESPDPPAFERLAEVNAPTLIVVGEVDIADVHAHAGVIEAFVSNSKRIVVPNAGHLAYLDQPETFNQIVQQFLSDE